MSEVMAVIGAGSIGQAIAWRVSAGKHVLLADLRQGNADTAAEVLSNAGFKVSTATVDVSSRESLHTLVETATALGDVTGVIHAAGGLTQPGVAPSPPSRDGGRRSARPVALCLETVSNPAERVRPSNGDTLSCLRLALPPSLHPAARSPCIWPVPDLDLASESCPSSREGSMATCDSLLIAEE
jgi:threonine dehydrogenase-like Zn-dependent dehydrogenase